LEVFRIDIYKARTKTLTKSEDKYIKDCQKYKAKSLASQQGQQIEKKRPDTIIPVQKVDQESFSKNGVTHNLG
jgi:hypothetical protein